MQNFIDTTKENSDYVQEIIEDLRLKYPNLKSKSIPIPFQEFQLLKSYQKIEILDIVEVEDLNRTALVSFLQTVEITTLRRDGSNTDIGIQIFIIVKLAKDYGHIFLKNESYVDKILDFFQKKDIDFEDDGAFNRQYLVLSKDITTAKLLLKESVRSILKLSTIKRISIEILGNLMVIKNESGGISEDLETIINLGLDLSKTQNP